MWADLIHAICRGDEWALACARYRNGESSQVLAREFSLSDTALLDRLRRSSVPIRRRGGATYDEATKARAVAMYADGASARDVAAEFGTAKNLITRWVLAAGGDLRRPRGRPTDPADPSS